MNKFFVSLLMFSALSASLGAQSRSVQDDDRPQIDVQSYAVDVTIVPEERRLIGKTSIRFTQQDRRNFAVFDLDRRLRVSAVTVGGADTRFRQFDLDSTIDVDLSNAQFSTDSVIQIEYSGILNPEEDRRDPVLGRVAENSAFLLYSGKWFPTNGLYKDPAEMMLRITVPDGWTVISDLPASNNPEFPLASRNASYWGTVAAGKYTSKTVTSEGADVTLNTLTVADDVATPIAESAARIFDFYRQTFGPAPAESIQIIEVEGANWISQWSAGAVFMPRTQLRTDFDMAALAKTIAHQWFPLKINVEDPSRDAWLVDGMAVFASIMYFERSLAPAEAQPHIERALVKALGYEGTTSVIQAGDLEKDSPDYNALVEYKGAFILRMLEWVTGEDKFKELLSSYVQEFQNKPASTEAFTRLATNIAGEDLTYFFDQWLNSSGVPEFEQEFTVFRTKDGYKVMGQIKQDLDLFKMPIELQIQTDGEPEYARVMVVGSTSDFDVATVRKPQNIVIDPRGRTLRMSKDLQVKVRINRGEELANDGEYNRAIDEYQSAIDLDQHNSLALFRMGEALFELGNLQAAANQFRESINGDLKPAWVEVWAYVNLGKIFDIRGQRERAVTEYQKAVNTGDDAYGAQAEAKKYLDEPFRRSGRPTIG
jgi:aminopeptidase N